MNVNILCWEVIFIDTEPDKFIYAFFFFSCLLYEGTRCCSALCIPALLFPAVLLSFIRSPSDAGVGFPRSCALCMCSFYLWGQMWCLHFVDIVQHSNLLFLLQRLYISLPVSSPVLPISLCHLRVCVSLFLSYLLSPDPPSLPTSPVKSMLLRS